MSFAARKAEMCEGDVVLLYTGFDSLVPLTVTLGVTHQTRYGALKHEALIGKTYGKKIECAKGWVCPLQPTPELWTLALPHRTQILYTPDISMVVSQLHLKPGSVVVEAGTGSGSLSHALIRAVMPTGRLHTFEFHQERCQAAQKEFEAHGLGDYVTAIHQDVCANGFELTNEADAVFLDLPAPWEAVNSARQALRQGGRICTFSPCIEQVQRTSLALTDAGFADLNTLEVLARPFNVHTLKMPQVHFGGAFSNPPGVENSKTHNDTKELNQMKNIEEKCEDQQESTDMDMETKDEAGEQRAKDDVKNKTRGVHANGGKGSGGVREFTTGAPPLVMRGHTGFLTFASLYG